MQIVLLRSKIRIGEHQRNHPGRDCVTVKGETRCSVGVQDIDVENIIYHPNYSRPNRFLNDIAIVKITKEAEMNGKRHINITCRNCNTCKNFNMILD